MPPADLKPEEKVNRPQFDSNRFPKLAGLLREKLRKREAIEIEDSKPSESPILPMKEDSANQNEAKEVIPIDSANTLVHVDKDLQGLPVFDVDAAFSKRCD